MSRTREEATVYAVDLGINSALNATRKRWVHGDGIVGFDAFEETERDFSASVRQPLPEWVERARRPVGEPYATWIARNGLWGRGRRAFTYHSRRMKGLAGHPTIPPWWCWGSGCAHLTLVSNCHFEGGPEPDYDVNLCIDGLVYEYAIRPYWWDEADVQAAYEVVSDGEVTAGEIASLHDIEREVWDEVEQDWVDKGTPAQKTRVRAIHAAWDEAVAQRLAFYKENDGVMQWRPFCTPPGDAEMALESLHDYGYPYVKVYGYSRVPLAYRDVERPDRIWRHATQCVMGWREESDGALDDMAWKQVGRTILNNIQKDGPIDGSITPETGPMIGEAFDLRIRKQEIHPRKRFKTQSDNYDPSQPVTWDNHPAYGFKNNLVEMDILCTVVSGSPSAGPQRRYIDITNSAQSLGLFTSTQHKPT